MKRANLDLLVMTFFETRKWPRASVEEIADHLGVAKRTVLRSLWRLERERQVQRVREGQRNWQLPEGTKSSRMIVS